MLACFVGTVVCTNPCWRGGCGSTSHSSTLRFTCPDKTSLYSTVIYETLAHICTNSKACSLKIPKELRMMTKQDTACSCYYLLYHVFLLLSWQHRASFNWFSAFKTIKNLRWLRSETVVEGRDLLFRLSTSTFPEGTETDRLLQGGGPPRKWTPVPTLQPRVSSIYHPWGFTGILNPVTHQHRRKLNISKIVSKTSCTATRQNWHCLCLWRCICACFARQTGRHLV